MIDTQDFPFSPPGASGWWSIFNVTYYGATGNGTTDDTAAIQAAINAAQNDGGGIVYFPAGTFVCNHASTQASTTVPLYFIGSGIDITTLFCTTSGIYCALEILCPGGVQDMTVNGGAVATQALLFATSNTSSNIDFWFCNRVKAQNISSSGEWVLALIGSETANVVQVNLLYLNDVIVSGPSASGTDAFAIANIGTAYVNNMTFRNLSRSPNFYGATLLFVNGIYVESVPNTAGVVFDEYVTEAHISNLYVDSASAQVFINAVFSFLSDSDIVTNTGSGALQLGTSVLSSVQKVSIDNCRVAGILIEATAANNPGQIYMTNSHLYASAVGTGAVIYDAHTASQSGIFLFSNCTFDSSQTDHVLQSNAGAVWTNGGFFNCAMSSGSWSVSTLTFGGGFHFSNVLGLNPVGASIPGTAWSLPASGTAWTNDTCVNGMLYVTAAGTVSAVSVQGVSVQTSLAVGESFFVPAGGTITFTYSVAPTLVFVGN